MAQGVASSWHAAGVVAALVFASLCVIRAGWTLSARYLHVLQLNSYQIDGYWRSLRRYAAEDLHPLFAVFAACVVCATALGVLLEALAPSFMGAAFAGAAVLFAIFSQLLKKKRGDKAQKKALVDTERMLRLKRTHRMALFAWSVVAGLCAAGAYFLLRAPLSEPIAVFAASFLLYLPFALLAQTVAVSARLRQGPERRINQGFIDEAKRILRARSDLIRIGITGSYGKTSSKFILGTLLSRRFQTLVPPGSYNTPMGVVRMVREMLKPSHQVMIAEMGARHESEIAELCNIVRPQYSLLTAIGRQHMETFGSFENIVKTKYEIMQALDENGVGFFPNDGGTCLELYRKFDGHKVLFGIGREENDVWAEDIASDAQGSAFVLCNAGRRQPCRTRLLGRHNVMNILGCAAVAMQLGMDLEEIAQGIAQVEPVEHRLQLINPGTGVAGDRRRVQQQPRRNAHGHGSAIHVRRLSEDLRNAGHGGAGR